MENITITIPRDTAYELFQLVGESKDTGNEEWDEHMKLVEKKLREKL